jgi:glyoxylase-like metal-dependent hydrolase (beta-lactamase superfamily II)
LEIAARIRRIGGDNIVNSYLVEDGGEVTIVDAGLSGLWNSLPSELAALGRTVDDVRSIVLTHGHSDHIGFAERGPRERGWSVRVHELDAALARGEVPNPAKGGGPMRPLPLLRFLWWSLRHGVRIHHLGAVSTYGDGATLDVPGSPQVTLVPGHTPGSAVLHFAGHDALLVGDALCTYAVTTGRGGPQIVPFSADPEDRSAIRRVRPGAPIVQKQRRRVSIVTRGFELQGNIHVHADGDMAQYLEASEPHFLPITDLTVRWLSDPARVAQFPFALVNREQLVSVIEESGPPASGLTDEEARSA